MLRAALAGRGGFWYGLGMPDKLRQPAAVLALFGGWLLIWLLFGTLGLAGAMLGTSVMWVTVGTATGYWIGTDAASEKMVTELMRRIRQRKSATGYSE